MQSPMNRTLCLLVVVTIAGVGCSKESGNSPASPTHPSTTNSPTLPPPIYVALFTHIEDNTPAGELGTPTSRSAYEIWRNRLIQMGEMTLRLGVTWSLQPDWKILEAARLYEDVSMTASTGGITLFRYLSENLNVIIDPHSHESGGYNYTDVAYLLGLLGVGGSTVIGGHIWDPSFTQFSHWERFRMPVFGEQYPTAIWRGSILMGSGTPNHINDPVVSGVWQPKSPSSYFEDDPTGNITAVGQWRNNISGISELAEHYRSELVQTTCMLTASYHITPGSLNNPTKIETNVIAPLSSLQASGKVELTDFTSLVATWQSRFGGRACIHLP